MKPIASIYLLAASAVLMFAGNAHGQVLTPGVPFVNESQIHLEGTEVWAGATGGSGTLANGLTYGQFNNSNFVASTVPGSTVQVDQDGAAFGDFTGSLSFPDPALNNSFLVFNVATGGQLFLYITGLTPGHVYLEQSFVALNNTGNINNAGTFNAVETITHENGFFSGPIATTTTPYGQTPDPLNPGQFLDNGIFTSTDTFLANNAGTAFIMFSNSTNGIDLLAASEIRDISDVPEPSTYALMFAGLAILGFCVRRKSALAK